MTYIYVSIFQAPLTGVLYDAASSLDAKASSVLRDGEWVETLPDMRTWPLFN